MRANTLLALENWWEALESSVYEGDLTPDVGTTKDDHGSLSLGLSFDVNLPAGDFGELWADAAWGAEE